MRNHSALYKCGGGCGVRRSSSPSYVSKLTTLSVRSLRVVVVVRQRVAKQRAWRKVDAAATYLVPHRLVECRHAQRVPRVHKRGRRRLCRHGQRVGRRRGARSRHRARRALVAPGGGRAVKPAAGRSLGRASRHPGGQPSGSGASAAGRAGAAWGGAPLPQDRGHPAHPPAGHDPPERRLSGST